jgi:3-oxoacyl-(acyl-carrier-protein) synthase
VRVVWCCAAARGPQSLQPALRLCSPHLPQATHTTPHHTGFRKMNPFCIPFAITNMSGALLAMDIGFMGPNYAINTGARVCVHVCTCVQRMCKDVLSACACCGAHRCTGSATDTR